MFRHRLQHHLNALHVMARLVHLGLPRPRARALARWWERVIHPVVYRAAPPHPRMRDLPRALVSVPDIRTRASVRLREMGYIRR